MRSLSQTAAAGWPLAASLALVLAGKGIREGRRRSALNRALHELRRPLQALALALHRPQASGGAAAIAAPSSLQLAISALADLDREINGPRAPVASIASPPNGVRWPSAATAGPRSGSGCRQLLWAAVARWRARASVAGGSLELRWRAGAEVTVREPGDVSQAVDNLIVNAIEHGGSEIVVDASRSPRGLRIAVADSGASSAEPKQSPAAIMARLTGRRSRGHGLAVVREIASAQGGRFMLRTSPEGSRAVLELPVCADEGAGVG